MEQLLKLVIIDETVQAVFRESVIWKFPISCLVLIGEYTTNEGPYKDDYFIEFVTVEDGKTFFSKISFYAEGRDQAFAILEKILSQPLILELYASTDWNSRVVWPPALSGRPFLRRTKPTSIFRAFMHRLGLRGSVQVLSDEVKVYIAEQVANGGNIHRHE